MLTYACVYGPEDIMRQYKCFNRFVESQWVFDISLVYRDDELILLFNNRLYWQVWARRYLTPIDREINGPHWGRWMERRIRLMLRLRARRARLGAKARHNGCPAK